MYSDESLLHGDSLDTLIQGVDLVCVTDWDREGLVRIFPATSIVVQCSHKSMIYIVNIPPSTDQNQQCMQTLLKAILLRWYIRAPGIHILRPAEA